MIGETLGSYRVVQKIGTGGMGIVYLAVHPLLGRKAVIKLLLPQYSNNPQVVTRFFHEARASALIGHPGIIDIFDFGHSPQGDAYLVMEYLEGESLQARMKRERLFAAPLVVAVSKQMCSALSAAHSKGIVHRDLKPDNVFLLPDRDTPSGFRVKVLDFGIAKLAREAMADSPGTNAGVTIGTPKYMSPEQCLDAAAVDGRADIYSLGCMMFEMVCGRPPFRADTYAEMLAQHIATPPPAPSALVDGVPAELETLILRSLEKDLARRYQSMDEMAADLDRIGASGRLPTEKPAAIAHREPTEALPEVTPAPEPAPKPKAKPQPSSNRATVLGKRSAEPLPMELEPTALAHTPVPAPETPPPHLQSGSIKTEPRPAVPPSPTPLPAPAPTPLPLPPQLPPQGYAPPSQAPPPMSSMVETSTTLGGAASEIRRPHGQRRAILPAAAIGVVLGLAGVAIAIALAQDDRPPPAPEASPAEAQSGSGSTASTESPSVSPSSSAARPSAAPTSNAPTTTPATPASPAAAPRSLVTLRIESDPAGADVFRADDGVRLGKTPVIQHVAKTSGEASFVLRRTGYREARLSIPMSRDGIGYVQLEKGKGGGAKAKKAGKDERPSPKTTSRKKPAPIKDGALDPFGE